MTITVYRFSFQNETLGPVESEESRNKDGKNCTPTICTTASNSFRVGFNTIQ